MANSEIEIDVKVDSSNANKNLDKLNNEAEKLESTFKDLGTKAGLVFASLTAGIGLAVSKAADFEKVNTQFEVLIGNAEKATATVEKLADFSAKTPFQFEEITRAGQQLLGFGFAADDLTNILQGIGDVAAASGTPLTDLALIFGQVSAAGKLTGERLLQMQERAIPIGPALAQTLGVAETAVKDLVSKGKVSFDIFAKAFQSISAEGGKAFQGMDKQSETLSGSLSTLGDNFSLLVTAIGIKFLPVIKKASSALISFIGVIRENKALVTYSAAVLAIGTALAGLVTAISISVIAFSKLRIAFIATTALVQGMTISVRALAGATGIGLLIVAISILATKWEESLSLMSALYRSFVGNIIDLGSGLKEYFAGIFTFDIDQIREGIDQAKSALSKGVDEFQAELEEKPVELPVTPVIEETPKLPSGKVSTNIQVEVGNNLQKASNALATVGKTLGDEFFGFFESLSNSATGILGSVFKIFGKVIAGPIGEAIGGLAEKAIDIFGVDPAQFQKDITKAISDIPEVLSNIIVNALSLVSGEFFDDIVTKFIDNIPMFVEKVTGALVRQLANPIFWIEIATVAAGAFIRAIPDIIQGLIDGIRQGAEDIFSPFKTLSEFAGEVFSSKILDAGKNFFNIIMQAAQRFFDGLTGGKITEIGEDLGLGGSTGQKVQDFLSSSAVGFAVGGGVGSVVGGAASALGIKSVGGTTGESSSGTKVFIGFTDNAFEIIEEKLIERQRLGISTL